MSDEIAEALGSLAAAQPDIGLAAAGGVAMDQEDHDDGRVKGVAQAAHERANEAHGLAEKAHELLAGLRRDFDHEVAALRSFLKIPANVPADRIGDVVTPPDAGPGQLVASAEILRALGTSASAGKTNKGDV